MALKTNNIMALSCVQRATEFLVTKAVKLRHFDAQVKILTGRISLGSVLKITQ